MVIILESLQNWGLKSVTQLNFKSHPRTVKKYMVVKCNKHLYERIDILTSGLPPRSPKSHQH